MPTARHKLNAASIPGILVIAGLVAALTGSWWVFLGLFAVLIATAVHAGDIRPTKRHRQKARLRDR